MRSISMICVAAMIAATIMFAACSGGDDNKSSVTPTTQQQTATSAATATKTAAGGSSSTHTTAATTSPAATKSTQTSGQAISMEACDLMTADDVKTALGDSSGNYENNSLGRQAVQDPFTSGNQCEWTDFNTGNGAWLIASFAPASAAAQVKQKLDSDCQGQETVSGLGDGACLPLYTSQIRVVKGGTYLDFFTGSVSGDAQKAALKTLAEHALARLP